MGCILGAIAGSLPFFRNLLMAPNAPLLPVFESLKTLGTAYLPAVLLVLAGSLAQGLKSFDMDIVWKVGALMVSRFCFMPLTAMALLQLGIRGGFIPDDHLLWFVLLMQSSMVSAGLALVPHPDSAYYSRLPRLNPSLSIVSFHVSYSRVLRTPW